MKRSPLLFLTLVISITLWGSNTFAKNGTPVSYTLIAYEANASVTLLLTETGNPENIIAQAVEHSGSRFDNFPHPGNIAFNDSPPYLMGKTAFNLRQQLHNLEHESETAAKSEAEPLVIKYFVIFIAGYDEHAHKMIGSVTKKNFYLAEVRKQLSQHDITLPEQIVLTGDDRLFTRAARENLEPGSTDRLEDANAVQLSTLAPAYEIRGDEVLTSTAPTNNRHGGDYQLGSKICQEHTNQAYRQQEEFGQIYDPVACAINALPEVQAFNDANPEPFFSRYGYKYFDRESVFANVHGYLGFEVLGREAPTGFNQTHWLEAQNILQYYVVGHTAQKVATYSVAHAVVQAVNRLEHESKYPLLSNGEHPKLHMLGERSWKDLGLDDELLGLLGEERASNAKIYSQDEFHLAVSKGAQRYMGLFPGLRRPPALETPVAQSDAEEEVATPSEPEEPLQPEEDASLASNEDTSQPPSDLREDDEEDDEDDDEDDDEEDDEDEDDEDRDEL